MEAVSVSACAATVEALSLLGARDAQAGPWFEFLPALPSLSELEFSRRGEPIEALGQALERCENLRLAIVGSYNDRGALDKFPIDRLTGVVRLRLRTQVGSKTVWPAGLEHLELEGLDLSPATLAGILERCPVLSSLSISRELPDGGVDALVWAPHRLVLALHERHWRDPELRAAHSLATRASVYIGWRTSGLSVELLDRGWV